MNIPLSPIELSFWYQYRYEPLSDAQNIVHRLVILKDYSDEQIKQSLAAILKKHSILRSRFHEENGTPYRDTKNEASFEYIDGNAHSDDSLTELARRAFILEQDNLVRIIVKRVEASTTLLITIPHIIFDAFSWSIFTNELIHNLKEPITYEKSITPLYPAIQEAAQNYWTDQLRDVDGRVDLERSASAPISTTLDTFLRNHEHVLFGRLSEFGKTHGLSMNTLCVAIFSLTLSKLTDTQRMIVATPVTTRDEHSMHHIGSYINVLPSVIEQELNSPFIKYAQGVASKIWDDIENRDFSLINTLSSTSTRYTDGRGIYNVMAEYIPESKLHPDIIEDVIVPNTHAKLDIIFSVTASIDDHVISVEYNASKLSRQYIDKVVKTFLTISSSILDDPGQIVRDIRLVNAQEEKELLLLGRGPEKEVRPPYVWNRFKDTASKKPNLTAITDNVSSITYSELLTLSQKYAGLLEINGVGKNQVVGVHMERSVDYIASMLALWSLGAIYLPLDPKQPKTRLESMVRQANAEVIIINQENILPISDILYLDITKADNALRFESSYEPQAEDTAYIIFTSGSTGTPKGVIIEHIGFLNHLEIMIEEFNIGPGDVVAQTAPPSFDISVWQLIGALMVGASLTIVNRNQLIDPDEMYHIIKDRSVTILEIVPSLISGYLSNEVGRADLSGQLKNLKIITTGEAISSSIVSQWMNAYPLTPLYNAYGPAEGSDDTHMYMIKEGITNPNQPIPIGRPLQNVHTYIVNRDMLLVPIGIVGEICIGGPVVAGGYIGNQELTDQAFLSNPNKETPGRLYRTGDYGRWNEDGTLSYHGRKDHQVKVRGQRLEIGEVEEQLRRVDGVADAAVIASTGQGGTKLTGYIIVQDPTITTSDIKNQLQSRLPEFMIPQKIEFLEQLPRSNNGKLDRKALEGRKDQTRNDDTDTYPLQHSPTLAAVIDVYSEVLETIVTQNSNYFDCGGDSLHSMRIASLLAKHDIAIGIRDILIYQTPLELATYIDTKSKKEAEDQAAWEALDCFTPIQQAYLEASGDKYRDTGEIQAVVIDLKTPVTSDELLHALTVITKAHSELTPLASSRPLVIENSWHSGETPQHIVEILRKDISLESPLIGCILSKNELILAAHHFVLDFYSWGLIQQELIALIANPDTLLKHENILSKWWGNAAETLKTDSKALKNAQDFWQPANNAAQRLPTNKTHRHIIECKLPYELTNALNKSSVSLESFAYYVYSLANTAINEQFEFSYSLESSLRAIDTTGALQSGIGWMTYVFPQKISKHQVSLDALLEFHQRTTASLQRGYEYGLLRYLICPEHFKNGQSTTWLLNYLGVGVMGTDRVRLIKATPRKNSAFTEVDIHYDNSKLHFDHYDNTGLDRHYFERLDSEAKRIIAALTNEYKKTAKTALSAERTSTILQRLRNANSN